MYKQFLQKKHLRSPSNASNESIDSHRSDITDNSSNIVLKIDVDLIAAFKGLLVKIWELGPHRITCTETEKDLRRKTARLYRLVAEVDYDGRGWPYYCKAFNEIALCDALDPSSKKQRAVDLMVLELSSHIVTWLKNECNQFTFSTYVEDLADSLKDYLYEGRTGKQIENYIRTISKGFDYDIDDDIEVRLDVVEKKLYFSNITYEQKEVWEILMKEGKNYKRVVKDRDFLLSSYSDEGIDVEEMRESINEYVQYVQEIPNMNDNFCQMNI